MRYRWRQRGGSGVEVINYDIDYIDLNLISFFRQMLEKGSSEKWPQQLQNLTGSSVMDVQPLIDYFSVLSKYLDEVLVDEEPGWTFNGNRLIISKYNSIICHSIQVDDYFEGGSSSTSTSTQSSDQTPTTDNSESTTESSANSIIASLLSLTFAILPIIIVVNFV